MNQKEKIIFIVQSILQNYEKDLKDEELEDLISIEKRIREFLKMARPELMLSTDEKKIYDRLTEEARKKGEIF